MVAHPIALLDQQMFRNHLKIGIVLHFATHSIAVHLTMHCIALNCNALHCTALYCTALRCTAVKSYPVLKCSITQLWQIYISSFTNTAAATAQIHPSCRRKSGEGQKLIQYWLRYWFRPRYCGILPLQKIQVMLMYELNITF